jgi:hypothetical protein
MNKGLGGAPDWAVDAARDTATNPAALDAFALVIAGAEGGPAYPGWQGREPDQALASRQASAIEAAMAPVKALVPGAGSYVAESNFFEANWQSAFWGENYARLSAVKLKYDPDGLFYVHHGVGSEDWDDHGFTPKSRL